MAFGGQPTRGGGSAELSFCPECEADSTVVWVWSAAESAVVCGNNGSSFSHLFGRLFHDLGAQVFSSLGINIYINFLLLVLGFFQPTD